MTYRYRCPLRWGDMDAQAHLNNGVYVDYLQEARVDFLTRSEVAPLLGGAGSDQPGRGVLVVSHQVEWRRPLVWGTEPLTVALDVTEVGGARFVVGYRVGDAEQPAAVARTVLAPYDLTAGRVLRLSPEQRAFFTGRLVPAEPLREVLTGPETPLPGHRTPISVRWSDLDAYGHVNNVRFFDYAQEGRVRLLHHVGDAVSAARSWLLVRQDVDYLRQVGYRSEPYQLLTEVVSVGRTSLVLRATLRGPERPEPLARVRTVAVCADPAGHPTPVPAEARDALLALPLGG